MASVFALSGCNNSLGVKDKAAVVEDGGVAGESAATSPDSWPAGVPLFEGGTLIQSEADESGSFHTATWTATGTPESIATAYGDDLAAAGFTSGEPYADETMSLTEFTGSDLKVTVYAALPQEASSTSGTADLTVTVEPAG